MSAYGDDGGLPVSAAVDGGGSSEAALEALCGALIAEPLWHVSLGSKELFHSNLLGWMSERFPEQARAVFKPFLTPDSTARTRVRREYKHLDLVIEFAGYAPLVIENKVFALPDETQLARYAAEPLAGMQGATAVLLSVTDPCWPDDRMQAGRFEWRYFGYRDLAPRLRAAFAQHSSFDAQVLLHEALLIDGLVAVIDLIGKPGLTHQIALTKAQTSILQAARLADGVGKTRAHHVMNLIHSEYTARGLTPTRTEVGFSRAQTLLAAFWDGPDGNGVGWQFQGGQWRLAMIVGTLHGRGPEKAAERARFAAEHIGWFDFTRLHDTLGVTDDDVRPTHARIAADAFNKYDPDFVYRYRLLPARTTVREFVDLAVGYAEAARAWQFKL